MWVAIDGVPAGMAALADEPRAGAAAAVRCCATYIISSLVKVALRSSATWPATIGT